MKLKLFALLILVTIAALPARAQCDLNATPANFTTQLAAAQSGQTLCLAAGSYNATNGKSGVTILGAPSSINGSVPVAGSKFVKINWTSGVCLQATNVLIDQSTFNGLNQSCNEGRLGLKGNGAGTIISNNTFGNGGPSDGIQLTASATGYHIGPGNLFINLTEEQCGSVHCDSIQMYGASNNVIDSNWFVNDSTIVMSPDCNGSPMTFTNNVVNQQAGSAAAALTIGGSTSADLFSHNTMVRGSFRIYGGNPGNCSAGATVKDNLTNMAGVIFVGGANPTTWAGYALAAGSAGKGQGTGGTDLGILVGPQPPPGIVVTVAPSSVTLPVNTTQQFTSTVTGTPNTTVNWASTCGTITATGLLSAGASPTSCQVKATSLQDSSKFGTSNVTVTSVTPPPAFPAPGKRLKTNGTANIRGTAVNNGFGPQVGTAPAAATGVILTVTNATIPNCTGCVWVQVDFDDPALPTGYIGSDNMTEITTPPPPPSLVVNCAIAKTGFTGSNIPAGSTLTITGNVPGAPAATCTTSFP